MQNIGTDVQDDQAGTKIAGRGTEVQFLKVIRDKILMDTNLK